MRNKIIFYGNGSCLNRGCEAILLGTHKIIEQAFGQGNCEYHDYHVTRKIWENRDRTEKPCIDLPNLTMEQFPCGIPPKRYSPIWFRRHFVCRVLRQKYYQEFAYEKEEDLMRNAMQSQAVLFLGGDNITLDYGYPEHYVILIKRMIDKGVRFVLWGASTGSFHKKPQYEKRMKNLFERMALIVVRESLSKNYLINLGLVNNVRQTADPAFAMSPIEFELPENIKSKLSDGAIGINLSPLIGEYHANPEKWFEIACKIVKGIDIHFKRPVMLIPHVMTHSNDYTFLSKVVETVHSQNIFLIEPYHAPYMKWLISQLSFFIGARTHSTIASLSTFVPTLSLGYSTKSEGINQDIFGHRNWVIPSTELMAQNVINKAIELDKNQNSIREYLRKVIPSYAQTAFDAGVFLKETLQ